MALWRYPCRVCGSPTDGVDTYVICSSCLAELDLEVRYDQHHGAPVECPTEATLTASETEARIRKLLDDW
jgi:hypothetical protein